MIERATEFQQDRIEMWMKVDDKFQDINSKLHRFPAYRILFFDTDLVQRSILAEPHFAFGLWLIKKSLEKDVLSSEEYSYPHKEVNKAA